MDRPLLEKLAWVAGILSFLYLLWPSDWAERGPIVVQVQPPPLPVPVVPHVPPVDLTNLVTEVGNCKIDHTTTENLKQDGLYDLFISYCAKGRASTIGQSFLIPHIHPDSRFQYFNPGEFNIDHGVSGGQITKVGLYNNLSDKISTCFQVAYNQGASPHERIDLELDCLQQSGLKAHDKTYYLLVQDARVEGINVLA